MNLIKLLFYLLIVSLSLGQFGRLPINQDGVSVYIYDIIAFVLVFYWFIYSLSVRKSLKIPKFYWYVVPFAAVSLISLINGKRWVDWKEWFVGSLYFIRWVVYSLTAIVSYNLSQFNKNRRSIVFYLLFSVFILVVIGFIQLAVLPDLSLLDPKLGWDPHRNRLVSSFFDPNFAGAFITIGLVLSLSKVLHSKRELALNILILLFLISLLLTFSRSAWLMLAIIIAVVGTLKSRGMLFLSLIVAFSAYYYVPRVQTRISGTTDPADSAHYRVISWKNTYKIVKDHLLLGVGFNTFRYAQERYGFFEDPDNPLGGRSGAGSDSSFLLAAATTGILGAVLYLLIYLNIFADSFKDYMNKGSWIDLSMMAITAGLLVNSQFINSLFFPQIMIFFWVLVGLKYARKGSDF